MQLSKACPFCGKTTQVVVPNDGFRKFRNGMPITAALPELNKFDREFCITGMCYSCQENTFHSPMPGNEEAWGPSLGECDCCGATIYEKKDNKKENIFKCGCCYMEYERDEEGNLVSLDDM